jgi:mannose-6-phosphate isomerase-like protein (cupin superfamily)
MGLPVDASITTPEIEAAAATAAPIPEKLHRRKTFLINPVVDTKSFLSIAVLLARLFLSWELSGSRAEIFKRGYAGCSMRKPTLIHQPTRVEAAGNKPKLIDEYIGRVNSATPMLSIAHMRSPGGWQEPGQRPDFDEFTVVVKGNLRVEYEGGIVDVCAGQAVIAHRGEWVRYSTPDKEGAEYFAVCVPAFSMETVHRDA